MELEKYEEKLAKLIQFPTISSDESYSKYFSEFRKTFKTLFPNVVKRCEYFEFNGGFYFILRGTNKDLEPILFMNHHDVVKASGNWSFEPFSGEIRDGKVCGRGTLDTKGGLFCMFQAMDELLSTGFTSKKDIYLLSTANEEINGDGANYITDQFKQMGIHFEFVIDEGGMIVYDPIGFSDGNFAMIGVGEKPAIDVKFTASSTGGHASAPGKNTPAIRLAKFMLDVENSHKFKKKMNKTIVKTLKTFSLKMHGVLKFLFKHPVFFAPLFKSVVAKKSPSMRAFFQTTVAFTEMEGSNAINVLPTNASVSTSVRVCHHQGIEDTMKVLNYYAKKYDIKVEIIDKPFNSRITDYNGQAFKNVSRVISEIFPDVVSTPYVSNSASDSRYFYKVCDQILCFVPFQIQSEDLDLIHGIDECVSVENLYKATNFYKKLIEASNE